MNNGKVDPAPVSPRLELAGLYVVATPIGNIGDLSTRAIDVLREVDVVAAEDTRTTGILLKRLGISRSMIALHDHNERSQSDRLVASLLDAKSVAIVSDAGTPLISDPGFRVVDAALDAGIRVSPIPGPSAVLTALCCSGQATDRFCFEGFIPSKSSQRIRFLQALVDEPRTMVFFESPHRVIDSIGDFVEVFGPDRSISITRELTKKFETVRRGDLASMFQWLKVSPDQSRGEFVLVLSGADVRQSERESDFDHTLVPLLDQLSLSQAVDLACKICDVPRNRVYRRALELKSDI